MTEVPYLAKLKQYISDEVRSHSEHRARIESHMIAKMAAEAHEAGRQFVGWPVFTDEYEEYMHVTKITARVWLIPR